MITQVHHSPFTIHISHSVHLPVLFFFRFLGRREKGEAVLIHSRIDARAECGSILVSQGIDISRGIWILRFLDFSSLGLELGLGLGLGLGLSVSL